MWRWNKTLFCFWLTQAVKLNNDTVHVSTEIGWYSLGESGWNYNEYKQEFNPIISGKATILMIHSSLMCAVVSMCKDTLWHIWTMKDFRGHDWLTALLPFSFSATYIIFCWQKC